MLGVIEDFVREFVDNKKAAHEIKLSMMKIQFGGNQSRFEFVLVR